MRALVAVLFTFCLAFQPGALARLTVTTERPDEDIIGEAFEQYTKAADLAAFAASLKARMSPEDYEFLRAKAESAKSIKPVVERIGPVELSVETEGVLVTLKLVSGEDRRFRVNGRSFTIAPNDGFQAVWEKVKAVYPSKKSARLIDHLLPRAEATLGVELAAVAAAIVVLGGISWTADNYRACGAYGSASNDCKMYLNEMNKYASRPNRTPAEDQAEADKAERWHLVLERLKRKVTARSLPYCPSGSPAAWQSCYQQFSARAKEAYGPLFDPPPTDGRGVVQPVPASR